VSFVLAALFGLLQSVVSGVEPLLALLKYLAYINVALGLFNLVPGFPLDEGGVLRAIVWGITHDMRRATLIAANVGRFIAYGKVERGWLGMSVQDLTPEIAKSIHVESLKGALITDVFKGGPAEKAGMRKNDVVIAYRGKEIPDSSTLQNEVAATTIGQEVKVTLLRNGKREELNLRIGNLESSTKFLAATVKERLGAEVRAVLSKEVNKYGLEDKQGVVIT